MVIINSFYVPGLRLRPVQGTEAGKRGGAMPLFQWFSATW
jgi:hypothetical protein